MPPNAVTADRVRTFLLEARFTADGVLARLGPEAFDALSRDLPVVVRRVLAGARAAADPAPPASLSPVAATEQTSPSERKPAAPSGRILDRLIEAFLLGDPILAADLPAGATADMIALGMLSRESDHLVALLDVRPYGEPDTDWFLVADLGAPADPAHVLGAGGASLTLARITPRRAVGSTLDLGCGAGVQALHAARHSGHIVATDTNPRALAHTALSAALSGVPAGLIEVRAGSLFEPVAGQAFDLIVSNPPFVISPDQRFSYRDAGLTGDELSRTVLRGAAAHLAPGGLAAVLVNWLDVAGQDWRDRVTGWVSDTGVNAWIVARDRQPVADYAATWLRDAQVPDGPEFDTAMDQWLDAFDEWGAEAVGFGWVVLAAPGRAAAPTPDAHPGGERPRRARRAAAGSRTGPRSVTGREPAPWVLVEDLTHAERLPTGDEVLAFLAGCAETEWMMALDLLRAPARLVAGATISTACVHSVSGDTTATPPRLGLAGTIGPGGWRPALTVHPVLLSALLAEHDARIGERLDAAAQAEGLTPLDVLAPALMGLRELIRVGIVRTH